MRFIDSLFAKRRSRAIVRTLPEYPPVILWGTERVSECARYAAALNLRNDPAKLCVIVKQLGEQEARRRYPEAFRSIFPEDALVPPPQKESGVIRG